MPQPGNASLLSGTWNCPPQCRRDTLLTDDLVLQTVLAGLRGNWLGVRARRRPQLVLRPRRARGLRAPQPAAERCPLRQPRWALRPSQWSHGRCTRSTPQVGVSQSLHKACTKMFSQMSLDVIQTDPTPNPYALCVLQAAGCPQALEARWVQRKACPTWPWLAWPLGALAQPRPARACQLVRGSACTCPLWRTASEQAASGWQRGRLFVLWIRPRLSCSAWPASLCRMCSSESKIPQRGLSVPPGRRAAPKSYAVVWHGHVIPCKQD